jgi:hypothetical protein
VSLTGTVFADNPEGPTVTPPTDRPWHRVAGPTTRKVSLAVFAATGTAVALAEWGLVPREVLLVGAPAIVATLLVDTFLYNEFLVDTGPGFWLLLYVFLFVQSLVVGAAVTWVARLLPAGDHTPPPD